ncbi:MAG TPA: MFS transporter [Thermomicrobiales bacterium]|nr:MFS transporter [Thermomicrobiales bacterium]
MSGATPAGSRPRDHSAPEDRNPAGTWLVPVLTLSTFVTMLQAMALGPLLPDISEDLDTSVSLLGQIPAATMFLAALIGFVAGPLADRLGHHRALLGGLVAVAVSSACMALAPQFALLLAAALIGSLGRAVVQPVAVVIAGDRFNGDRQRRAVSWVMAGVTGAVIAGVPALTTVAEAFGWRAALAGLAGLSAALVPFVRLGLGSAEPPSAPGATLTRVFSAYHPLLAHRPTLALIIATLLGSAGIWVMATYLGAFYDEQHGYTTRQIGWVYFVPGVTLFLGSLAAGSRIGALPLRPIFVIARVVTGLAIAGVLALPIPAIMGVGLLAVQGLSTGLSGVAVVLLLMRESPAGHATTLTLNTAALSLGTGLGSTLGGLLLSIGDFELLGLAALLLSVASGALVWAVPVRAEHMSRVPSISRPT